jgi:ubiquinone/menaquinone biosynthesis C-methylase UbiE
MDKHVQQNKAYWDEITPVHVRSSFYDIDGFIAGKKQMIMPCELEEMGDIHGKSLLHLQCHIGMDTLAWARRGAKVTGVDFSGEAISTARKLSDETGIKSRFIESDIYALPDILNEKFDIVYTGAGAICWLPDLKKWGEIIARFLKPGGFFYIMEGHPFMSVFGNGPDVKDLQVKNPYFHNPEWLEMNPGNDYADSSYAIKNKESEWMHPVSEILNSLIDAGLKIEFFHEHPMIFFKVLPFMVQDKDGYWRLKDDLLPQIFSLKASKPQG